MSDTPENKDQIGSVHSDRGATDRKSEPQPRPRRVRRAVLVSLVSLVGLAIAATIGMYAFVNHAVSSIPRVHVGNLARSGTGSGETLLITGSPWEPTGTVIQGMPTTYSKLFLLLHINANGHTGGVVGIPGDAMVPVPGLGTKPLWYALKAGGPTLLVQTVSQFTGVPINHYAEIDLNHLTSLVDAVGGVSVALSAASTSSGHTFFPGVNHLTGITAIYFARDPSLSDEVALLRQESLLRAILSKISSDHLLTDPVTAIRLLNAITGTLTVDSNLTNSQIESLARKLGDLGGNAATFVTAPTRIVNGQLVLDTPVADQLWTATEKNSIAKFAIAFPATVTPQVVP